MSILCIYYDGASATGPMNLPITAQQKLDGSGSVSSLHAVAWPTRNACGYYEAITTAADSGYVTMASHWPTEPTDGKFTQVIDTQITQAAYDQIAVDEAAAQHEEDAPEGTLINYSKLQKWSRHMIEQLCLQHWTAEQTETYMRAKWDDLE